MIERTERNQMIRLEERLVAPGYTGVEDIPKEIEQAAANVFPGYPPLDERVRMTDDEIAAWKARGSKQSELPIPVVDQHPNYLSGVAKGKADAYDRNDDSLPLIPEPYLSLMLKAGAVRGPGFYWKLGKNPAGDPVVVREKDGKLEILTIERTDTPGKYALPGGMEDPGEKGASAAIRELLEEVGLDFADVPHEIVFDYATDPTGGYVFGDTRATLNAIGVSCVVLLTPPTEKTKGMKFKPAAEEVWKVEWIDAADRNLRMEKFAAAAHVRFIKLAILRWQEMTGKVVAKDGTIGNPA